MQLFYTPDIIPENKTAFLDKEESKHLNKVLRKKSGDIITLTNGLGYFFTAQIVTINQKQTVLNIIHTELVTLRNYYLHLAVAPTKMNDRYEWFLEKATEIGINEITPIICDNSERKLIKMDRFEKIIQSAMKQSLQSWLPKLNPPVLFNNFIKQPIDGQLFLAHCYKTERYSLKRKALADHKITILIGPEGDFSHQEVTNALESNFIPISLGNTRLRTETAAITACHTIALINE